MHLTSLRFACIALTLALGAVAQTTPPPNRFEKNVEAYETADKTSPPSANAILLAGDSQFYRWKTLHEDLPGYTVVNRGIDSFQTSDWLFCRPARPALSSRD